MYLKINDCIRFLHDSTKVERIQKYFGIEVISINKINEDKSARNYNTAADIKSSDIDGKHNCKYQIKNWFFYYFFTFLTYLGNEIFYILFLPILTWNFDDKVICLTCVSWAISMYLGQASKEIFKIPRPFTPPVVKLEKQYVEEFGFPSTHAMAAMSICYTFH